MGADEAAASVIPRESQEHEFVSTQLNKRGSISLSKFRLISEIHMALIQGTILLVGSEWTLEFLEL